MALFNGHVPRKAAGVQPGYIYKELPTAAQRGRCRT